jgi:hypothetical protein
MLFFEDFGDYIHSMKQQIAKKTLPEKRVEWLEQNHVRGRDLTQLLL